jgi:hypothetical protein
MCSRPRAPSDYTDTWDATAALLRLTTSLFCVADYVTLIEASPLAASPAAPLPLVAGSLTQACGKGRFLRRAPATEPGALRGWRRRHVRLPVGGRHRCDVAGRSLPLQRRRSAAEVLEHFGCRRQCRHRSWLRLSPPLVAPPLVVPATRAAEVRRHRSCRPVETLFRGSSDFEGVAAVTSLVDVRRGGRGDEKGYSV